MHPFTLLLDLALSIHPIYPCHPSYLVKKRFEFFYRHFFLDWGSPILLSSSSSFDHAVTYLLECTGIRCTTRKKVKDQEMHDFS